MRTDDIKFHEYRREAIQKATKLCEGKKNKAYSNGGVKIRDYYRFHGIKGLAYELHKRALRMISTTEQNLAPKDMADSIEDMALDHINYASFLYAEAHCLRRDEAIKGLEEVTT